MKSSLAWDANERVENYKRSVVLVQQNVLSVKGFLGPSLKDKPELSSVGARAARAAGVIVDELGKLRCPPGTPNANQFTDMQMSNCMVPGMEVAKRLARSSRREVGQALQNMKRVLENKNVSKGATVAAMAALATLDALDYLNVDGSGTLSAMTLVGVDMLRTAGRDVAELALNRLERKGKITKEQRADIDKIIDKVNEVGSSKYASAAMAMLRRRNRKRNRRLETPQMDKADAAPPDKSARPEDLMKVTFDTDSFHTELEAKVSKLLDHYVPESKHKNFESFGDELMAKMGIPPTDRSATKMLDDGLEHMQKTLPFNIAELKKRELALDDTHFATRTEVAEQLQKIYDIMQTEDGKKSVREELGKGMVETLAGIELMMQDNPSLRGRFTFEIHSNRDSSPAQCAAYAFLASYNDGRVIPAQRMLAQSLIINKTGISAGQVENGDMYSNVVRIAGVDDYQITLGLHETAHVMHYAENMRRLGVDTSASSKPVLDQMKAQSNRIGDTYLGAKFALTYGIDLDADWDDVESMWNDDARAIAVWGYGAKLDKRDGATLRSKFGKFASQEGHRDGVDGGILAEMSHLTRLSYEDSAKAEFFTQAITAIRDNEMKRLYGFDDERLSDMTVVRQQLESALDGQTIEQFLEEGKRFLDDSFGVDFTRLSMGGLTDEDVMKNLGQSSLYGKTNGWEAVAEAKTLEMMVKHFPDTKVFDDLKYDELKNDLEKVIPSGQRTFKSAVMSPEAIAWVRKLQDTVERMPEFKRAERGII